MIVIDRPGGIPAASTRGLPAFRLDRTLQTLLERRVCSMDVPTRKPPRSAYLLPGAQTLPLLSVRVNARLQPIIGSNGRRVIVRSLVTRIPASKNSSRRTSTPDALRRFAHLRP